MLQCVFYMVYVMKCVLKGYLNMLIYVRMKYAIVYVLYIVKLGLQLVVAGFRYGVLVVAAPASS